MRACACLFGLMPLGATATSLDEARALHQAGRLDEAVSAYRAVAAGGASAEDAGTARNNACVVLMDLGDYAAALAECEEARRLREPLDDARGFARTLNNTGLALQRLGRHPEAEAAYRAALAINRARGDAEAEAINLRNLALLASLEGRFSQARDQLATVMRITQAHAGEPWAADQRRLATLNLGVILEKLGAYDEALERYRELLPDIEALAPPHRAALQINVGVVYRNLGDPVRALEAFRAGVAAYESLGDVASLSNAWLNIGLVHHLELRDIASAESDYRRALALAEQSGDREEETWDRVYLGRVLLESDRFDEAQQALETALQVATGSASADGRWTALEGLARIAIARDDDEEGLARLLEAISVIETVRRDVPGPALRAHFFVDKRAVYGAAVSVLARLDGVRPGAGFADRALELVQRAKARELLEALGPTAQPADPLDAARLRESTGDDVVLEYFIGERHLYRWSIRRAAIELRDLGPVAPVRAAIESVHAALARGAAPEHAALGALSAMLLGDLELPAAAALYVAPDGALQYLPFELLSLPQEPEIGVRAGSDPFDESLLARTTISYLPSASTLAWLRASIVESELTLLAFGDVPPRAAGDPESAMPLEDLTLAPLTQSLRELAAARRALPGRHEVLTGRLASEGAYRARAGQAAVVVHLAAHALVDERPGRGAAIVLAPSEHADGLLRPDEIVAERHPAALTVLAACRSAAGALEGGRALASLTGAFLASGSRAVVATLWDVDDATTAAFMEQFYYELGRGVSASAALQRVKLRLRAAPEWGNPSLWSGYVLIGEATLPLTRREPPVRPSALALGAFGLVLLAGLGVRRYGRAASPRGT